MGDAEDIFGGLACAAFCGICCAVAAEEDKKEREQSILLREGKTIDGLDSKDPKNVIQVTPVAVTSMTTGTIEIPYQKNRQQSTIQKRKSKY